MVKNFDKVFVINRSDRPERMEGFNKEIEREKVNWRIELCRGVIEKAPEYYTLGDGAWGCLNAHFNILKAFKNSDWKNVFVFEDDVALKKGFGDRLRMFSIPLDWDFLYLGGQPLKQTEKHSPMVYRCCNINRTHAYAINRKCLDVVYDAVSELPNKHIDSIYGELHMKLKAYIVKPVLCGQRAGYSDIGNSKTFWKERYWG